MKKETHSTLSKSKKKPDFLAAYCKKCRKKQPVNIQVMLPPKGMEKVLKELQIISCGVCEIVLNIDRNVNVVPVTEEWMNRKGWIKQTKTSKKRKK